MLILKNTTFINWNSLTFSHGHLIVDQGVNGTARLVQNLPTITPADTVLDCQNKYVTKSFGCGHHHVYSALLTGMPAPYKTPQTFYEILKYIWWNLDKSLDLDILKASALVTAVECAKRGVTFVIDHHASPFVVENSLETIADAFNQVGVGHLLCYEISDRDGVDLARKALAETDHYLQSHQGLVGLHASFTLTNKTLQKAVDLAKKHNTGIHVHVAEDLYDQEQCYEIHNKRVIERFSEVGILSLPASLLVHCLYLTRHERQLIHDSSVNVVQNTESNLNTCSGQFSSCALGQNIMLGTDGLHNDMLRSAKVSYFTDQMNDVVTPEIMYHRFRNIHHYLARNGFKGDGDNNLVVLDYNPMTEFDEHNFFGHFINGIDATHIQHVISNGKLVVHNRVVTTVNEAEIKQFSREMGKKLWKSMQTAKI